MTSILTAPAWLAPDYRYAGDAWTGDNALIYIVYETAPVYAADGVTIATPGVPRALAGCSVTGTLRYQTPGRRAAPSANVAPITAVGAIVDSASGIISLSLTSAQTIFPAQDYECWGDPRHALLIAQPRVVDVNGNPLTVGKQPIFVF